MRTPPRQAGLLLIIFAREFGAYPMKAFVGITDREWFDTKESELWRIQ